MNDILHGQLNQLRIISKVRIGQRLNTTNNLTVYEDSILNWLRRKYYHDSKDETVRLLQDLYRTINQSATQLIADIRTTRDEQVRLSKMQVALTLASLINTSIKGVENLSNTYSTYTRTTSILHGIVQDFAIVTYTQLLNVILVHIYTKDLKNSVLYNGHIIYLGINAKIQADNQAEYNPVHLVPVPTTSIMTSNSSPQVTQRSCPPITGDIQGNHIVS
jgi:hypothetical protein